MSDHHGSRGHAKRFNEAGLLYEAAGLIGATLDPDRIYDILHTMIARVMDCDSLLVSEFDPAAESIRCVYAWVEGRRVDVGQFPVVPLAPAGTGMQSQVIRSGRPLRLNSAEEQALTGRKRHYVEADGTVSDEPGDDPPESLLFVPIFLEGRVLGTAQVMSLRRDAYTDAHLRFLEALLTQVAAASRNAYLYQQAQTELAERRRFEAENARLLREAQEAAIRQRAFLRDVLSSVTEGRLRLCDSPDQLPAPPPWMTAEPLDVSAATLGALRRLVRNAAQGQGLSALQGQDVTTAASEAAMNAVVHAGGGWAKVAAGAGRVQVWVWDTGQGISVEDLPRATLERGYTTAGTFGHGFKMMLQMVDSIWLLTGEGGTTVVQEQDANSRRNP